MIFTMIVRSLTPSTEENAELIRKLVEDAVLSYANGFKQRHIAERNNPDGKINMKIHNAFIAALGQETQYYSALVRSLDSSMGNMLEKLAVSVAQLNYDVYKNVEGPLSPEQTRIIAELLEQYKRHTKKPEVSDYKVLREKPPLGSAVTKRHDSDYYLVDRETQENLLIELKIGGDLDNKKARSEKEAILEQYAILSNTLDDDAVINVYFGTAYNRYGEDKPWTQSRVKQFFADDELLVGKDFWNLVTKSSDGYAIVTDAYRKSAHHISEALDEIRAVYLD
jgi:hypothetical protein